MNHVLIKAVLSVAIILTATGIARRFPSLAGLIGVMPLTGALVLVWTYIENRGDRAVMQGLVKGSIYGLVPALLFFLVAFIGFKRGISLPVVISISFAAWLLGAFVHQMTLK
jgi:uncharacterized membrane protein (GlpM family)